MYLCTQRKPIVKPCMAKVMKIRSLSIFAISPEKCRWWICFFYLQINMKIYKYSIFPISKSFQYLCNISRKMLRWKFKLSNWKYHFRWMWPVMPKLLKIISLIFLCIMLKKKWVMKFIFCSRISMKVSCKLILWFFMGLVKHSRSSQSSKFAMSLQYLRKS